MRKIQALAGFLLSPITDPDKKKSSQGDSLLPLDGLRGLAVLIVITCHSGAFGMAGQGGIGVFLFFLLSGFVLAVPFARRKELSIGWRGTWQFFANRALRIYPAFTVAVLVIAWQIGEGGAWIAKNLTMREGWNHLWTVIEEARFYILFPFTILAISFLKTRLAQCIGLVVLICASWLWIRQTPVYFWMFLIGVLVCFIYETEAARRFIRRSGPQKIFGALSLAALAVIVLSAPERMRSEWVVPEMWCVLCLMILFGALTAPNSVVGRWMASWHMRHLGLLSYGLYLYHVPVLTALQALGLERSKLFFATFAATWVVAYGSYVVIEKPFLSLKVFDPMSAYRLRRAQIVPPRL